MAGKKRRGRRPDVPDLGNREFCCPRCSHRFEVPWVEIFELQEMTHGFVGFETQNEYISCPKCGANANPEPWAAE